MQIRYDANVDVLTFVLRDLPPADSVAESGGLIIAYGKDHDPVSVEILSASRRGMIDPNQTTFQIITSRP